VTPARERRHQQRRTAGTGGRPAYYSGRRVQLVQRHAAGRRRGGQPISAIAPSRSPFPAPCSPSISRRARTGASSPSSPPATATPSRPTASSPSARERDPHEQHLRREAGEPPRVGPARLRRVADGRHRRRLLARAFDPLRRADERSAADSRTSSSRTCRSRDTGHAVFHSKHRLVDRVRVVPRGGGRRRARVDLHRPRPAAHAVAQGDDSRAPHRTTGPAISRT